MSCSVFLLASSINCTVNLPEAGRAPLRINSRYRKKHNLLHHHELHISLQYDMSFQLSQDVSEYLKMSGVTWEASLQIVTASTAALMNSLPDHPFSVDFVRSLLSLKTTIGNIMHGSHYRWCHVYPLGAYGCHRPGALCPSFVFHLNCMRGCVGTVTHISTLRSPPLVEFFVELLVEL